MVFTDSAAFDIGLSYFIGKIIMKINITLAREMEKEARRIAADIIGNESHWEMFLQEAYDKILRKKFHKRSRQNG